MEDLLKISNCHGEYDRVDEKPFREEDDDFKEVVLRYLKIMLAHKWAFLFIVSLVLLVAVIYAIKSPKYYRSTYEIFYNESIKDFVVESDVPVIKSNFDKDYWLSAMKSTMIVRLTSEHSGLPYDADEVSRMVRVEMKNGKNNNFPIYEVTVTSPVPEHIPVLVNSYVQALNDLLLRNQNINSEKLTAFLGRQLEDNTKKLGKIDKQIMEETAGQSKT